MPEGPVDRVAGQPRTDEPPTVPQQQHGETVDPTRRPEFADGRTEAPTTKYPTPEPAGPASVTSPFDQPTTPEGIPTGTPATTSTDTDTSLLNGQDVERFRGRLRELQADFVDAPERVVQEAKELLGEAMAALAYAVTEHKRALDDESPGGDTEGLRVTLRRYRSTLDRLLSV